MSRNHHDEGCCFDDHDEREAKGKEEFRHGKEEKGRISNYSK